MMHAKAASLNRSLSLINLQGGWPTPRLHPAAALRTAAANALSSPDINQRLRYGPDAGDPSLRQNIAKWLTKMYRNRPHSNLEPVSSDNIAITNGASNGLVALLQKFTDPGLTRNVWMVEPTYFLACGILRDGGFSGRLRAVPEGRHGGIDLGYFRRVLEESEKEAGPGKPTSPTQKTEKTGYPKIYTHVLYMVPTFSNPSGRTMSLEQREELILLAREFDILVVTDDVYDFLSWPKKEDESAGTKDREIIPPRIADMDAMVKGTLPYGNAVSNGTFSKIVAPGVRVGWLQGTPAFIKAMETHAATHSGGCQSQMSSLIINEMLADGIIDRHIQQELVPTYSKRYHAMTKAIREHLYPLGVRIVNEADTEESDQRDNAGGFFLYIIFTENGSAEDVNEIARVAQDEYSLVIAKGDMFTVPDPTNPERNQGQPMSYVHGARLCWAFHEEDELVEGIERLSAVLKQVKKEN